MVNGGTPRCSARNSSRSVVMRRILFALLCACAFLSPALVTGPAQAGYWYRGDDYYGGGYYHSSYYGDGYYRRHYSYDDGDYYRPRHYAGTWYTSSCCYRRVVRHTAWYERTYRSAYYGDGYYYHRPYYRYGYDGYYRPYRYGYYDRPYYRDYSYYHRPYRYSYYDDRPSYYGGYYAAGYYGWRGAYAGCGRIRIPDGRGGWVWGYSAC